MIYRLPVFALIAAIITSGAVFAAEYKGPSALVASKDGSKIYVTNFDANEVAVVSTSENKVVDTFKVGFEPTGIAISPDGSTLYVTCGEAKGVVQVLDAETGKLEKEVASGHTPNPPVVTPDGKRLYVPNRFDKVPNVAEFSLPDMTLVKRHEMIREPFAAVATKDGKSVFVINHLPNDPSDSFDVAAEVACIDVASGELKNIRLPNGSGSLNDLVLSSDGKYLFVTEILARYQMPTTQVERGWMNTNGISIIDVEKREYLNTVLFDDVDLGAANPWGIDISPDGKWLYVAISGTHEVCVVDVEGMMNKLLSLPKNAEEARAAAGGGRGTFTGATAENVPNDLAFLVGLKKRIKLEGKGPRALVFCGDKVWTGMYFSDTLLKVDPNAAGSVKFETIPLGPTPELTAQRRGESNWNDATLCFQHWQSCASCHPDARVDAYNWDLLNDGMGNPKNVKSMLNCHNCPPAMWHGVRASSAVAVGTGFKHIHFSVRTQAELDDTEAYIVSLKQVESPYLIDGKLSEAAERGKKIFNDPKVGCAVCHSGDFYTDQKMHDVGTKNSFDRKAEFDTPHLTECWRTGPYLHDGRYVKMRDVFLKGLHGETQGDVGGLSEEQVDDLCEFILSL